MNTSVVAEIQKLLEEGKKDEARAVLREALGAPLTDEERGALLVGFAAAYLALQNSVDETHLMSLREEAAVLERMNSIQKNIDHGLNLAKVREELTQ